LEEMHWAESTTLTHVSTVLRQDPNLCKALLQCFKGSGASASAAVISTREGEDGSKETVTSPLRFMNVKPFLMALLLSSASMPRQRQTCLDLIRDLVLEEASIWIKRKESAWVNCVVGSTQKESPSSPVDFSLKQLLNPERMHVIHTLQKVIDFAAQGSSYGGGGSTFLSTLVQLGFVLVDCVKKDVSVSQSSTFAWPVSEYFSLSQNAHLPTPQQLTSRSGLHLLSYLFRVFNEGDGHDSATPSSSLRRFILQTAAGKVCGGAPNAVHHSRLLVQLTEHADSLTPLTEFIDTLIEWIGHLPSGGMPAAGKISYQLNHLVAVDCPLV